MLIPIPFTKNSTVVSVTQSPPTTGSVNDEKLDSKSPLVKTKKDVHGWRPPTSYSRTVRDQFTQAANFQCTSKGKWPNCAGGNQFTEFYSGGAYNGAANTPPFPQSLRDSAVIKARLKLKGEVVNLSENFATRLQTAEMIATTCGRLSEGIRAAKRLDARGIQRALGLTHKKIFKEKDPFKLWLGHIYGWQPMLGDIHNAVNRISDGYERGERGIVTVKGSASSSSTDDVLFSVPGFYTLWNFKRYGDVKQSCLVRLDYVEGSGVGSVGLRTASELGLLNPFELAWELLPGSFIADWFIPVGDFLSQLDADLGWQFKGGSISEKTTVRRRISFVNMTSQTACGAHTFFSGSATCDNPKSRDFKFERNTYGTSPLPSLPDLTKFRKRSSVHAANGIALLTTNARSLVNLGERLASGWTGRRHYSD